MAVSGGAPVATHYTLEFVERALPAGATDILEIGCGTGELAAALGERGLKVLAIDSDETCIDAGKARGIDARLAEWPTTLDRRFDAVLFTRSLHHIHDLAGALAAAVEVLNPGGRVIVEDFRAEGAEDRSRSWANGLIDVLSAAQAFRSGEVAAWLRDKIGPSDGHGHELHSSQAIADALNAHGETESEPAAYYFRYFEPELSGSATEAVLRAELDLIAAGAIDALGRRFVLTPRS